MNDVTVIVPTRNRPELLRQTLAAIASVRDDDDLDIDAYRELLDRVVDEIGDASNRVRYTMNGFVIAVGAYVQPLLRQAKATAKKLTRGLASSAVIMITITTIVR